jgi:hypothetical protein
LGNRLKRGRSPLQASPDPPGSGEFAALDSVEDRSQHLGGGSRLALLHIEMMAGVVSGVFLRTGEASQ